MKKLLLVCALLVSAVSFSNAQGQGGAGGAGFAQAAPEDRAKTTLDNQRIATLALTADQKTKATPILVNLYKAQTEMRTAAGADMASLFTNPKYVALGTDAEKSLVALLTADQKKAYDALLATAKERNPAATGVIATGGGFGGRGGAGGQGGGAPRPAGQ